MDTTRARYDQLDAYRGLAAVAIVAFHAYTLLYGDGYSPPAPGAGWTFAFATIRNMEAGVAFFFALSGFVIFQPFARALVAGERLPAPGPYAIRRAFRLLPLYYVALVATWALQGGGDPAQFWTHATLTNAFSPRWNATLIAWSLSSEALYYALVPPLAWLLLRLGRGRDRRGRIAICLAALALLVAASEAHKAVAVASGLAPLYLGHHFINGWLYFDPLGRGDSFVCGMAVAVAVACGVSLRPAPRRALAVAGAAILAAACWWRFAAVPMSLYFHSLCGLGFACAIGASVLGPQRARTARGSRPLVKLGAVSYGLFLWHAPVVRDLALRLGAIDRAAPNLAATFLWLIVPGLALAAASYWLVEVPGIALGRWLLSFRSGRHRRLRPTADIPLDAGAQPINRPLAGG